MGGKSMGSIVLFSTCIEVEVDCHAVIHSRLETIFESSKLSYHNLLLDGNLIGV